MNRYKIFVYATNEYGTQFVAEIEKEADKALITSNGDLKLCTKQGGLLVAWAAETWDSVELVQPEPTPEQTGDVSSIS